jgi:hypothetical protein
LAAVPASQPIYPTLPLCTCICTPLHGTCCMHACTQPHVAIGYLACTYRISDWLTCLCVRRPVLYTSLWFCHLIRVHPRHHATYRLACQGQPVLTSRSHTVQTLDKYLKVGSVLCSSVERREATWLAAACFKRITTVVEWHIHSAAT